MSRSRRATTPTVTRRSVTFAPSKDDARSAPKAGPPVTCTVSPSGAAAATSARIALTVSAVSEPSRPSVTSRVTTTALPSSDRCGRSPSAVIAATSSAVSRPPSSRVPTRRTGARPASGKCVSRSATTADSAEPGKASPRGGTSAERIAPETRMVARTMRRTATRAPHREVRRAARPVDAVSGGGATDDAVVGAGVRVMPPSPSGATPGAHHATDGTGNQPNDGPRPPPRGHAARARCHRRTP